MGAIPRRYQNFSRVNTQNNPFYWEKFPTNRRRCFVSHFTPLRFPFFSLNFPLVSLFSIGNTKKILHDFFCVSRPPHPPRRTLQARRERRRQGSDEIQQHAIKKETD